MYYKTDASVSDRSPIFAELLPKISLPKPRDRNDKKRKHQYSKSIIVRKVVFLLIENNLQIVSHNYKPVFYRNRKM